MVEPRDKAAVRAVLERLWGDVSWAVSHPAACTLHAHRKQWRAVLAHTHLFCFQVRLAAIKVIEKLAEPGDQQVSGTQSLVLVPSWAASKLFPLLFFSVYRWTSRSSLLFWDGLETPKHRGDSRSR